MVLYISLRGCVTSVGYAGDELLREGQFPGGWDVEPQQVSDDGEERQWNPSRLTDEGRETSERGGKRRGVRHSGREGRAPVEPLPPIYRGERRVREEGRGVRHSGREGRAPVEPLPPDRGGKGRA